MAVILAIHVIISIFLIGIILLQKNEGGLGGLGGGSGGMGGFMSGRAKSNVLSRTTGGLAVAFFATSMILAVMATHGTDRGPLVPDTGTVVPEAPAQAPAEPLPEPTTPTVPAGQ